MSTREASPLFSPPELDFSFVIPARKAGDFLPHTVEAVLDLFKTRFQGKSFEIILVPNPALDAVLTPEGDHSIEVSQKLAANNREKIRVHPHFQPEGKGAALKTGLLQCRGRFMFFTDADLPYDLYFFKEALSLLEQDFHLVTANRRHLDSQFDIPLPLLPLAYKRHRLGLIFNQLVRILFPSIQTHDTQAGMKAFSRELAQHFVRKQLCPGFFFDVELFLAAQALEMKIAERPVILYLRNEASTVRILKQSGLALWWIAKLWWAQLRGHYRARLSAQDL